MLLSKKIDEILEKALYEEELFSEDILTLLNITEEMALDKLFQVARFLRAKYFKNKIFYY